MKVLFNSPRTGTFSCIKNKPGYLILNESCKITNVLCEAYKITNEANNVRSDICAPMHTCFPLRMPRSFSNVKNSHIMNVNFESTACFLTKYFVFIIIVVQHRVPSDTSAFAELDTLS